MQSFYVDKTLDMFQILQKAIRRFKIYFTFSYGIKQLYILKKRFLRFFGVKIVFVDKLAKYYHGLHTSIKSM